MLAAEKTFLACEIYDFTALSEAREHDWSLVSPRYPSAQSAFTWDAKPIPTFAMWRTFRSQKLLLLHRKLPVPIEPSHLPDLSVILVPRSLSGL